MSTDTKHDDFSCPFWRNCVHGNEGNGHDMCVDATRNPDGLWACQWFEERPVIKGFAKCPDPPEIPLEYL